MPKFTPLQLLSYAVGFAAMFVASQADKEGMRKEVQEAVEAALNGRDAKLVSPPVTK